MSTRYFARKKEAAQNPYTGFTSFQHFRDEALYSDVIVRPENRLCETENLECYPVPADVPQNGRAEGWYPDATVAYFRMLWKEFEPVQGEYHYEVIEELLNTARAKGQSVTFRLIPHSTRASDDVPDWLKTLIPCPERPDGERVKDSPTDPLFLQLFGNAIRKIGQRFDTDPTFHTVDICLPGAWGEGHNLHLYPDEDIRGLVDVFLESFPHTNLVAQIGLPWLVNYCNKKRPVGWRGDGCGSPAHLNKIYPERVAQLTPDLWKQAPVSFEAYWWIGEWQRQGWDLDDIIEKTLDWHVSVFNAKSVPVPFQWQPKIEAWLEKMGYHYSPAFLACPDTAKAGEKAAFILEMDNTGVAPLYEKVTVWLRLRNEAGTVTLDTGLQPITWLPGKTTDAFCLHLPKELAAGRYAVSMGITGDTVPMIYFAMDAPQDGAFFEMGELEITAE